MSGPSEDEVRECARRAAEILREDGWCQGVSRDERGAHCAAGAVWEACPGPGGYPVRLLTQIRLGRVIGTQVVSWNDTPGRTAEEVIAALGRVAAGEGGDR